MQTKNRYRSDYKIYFRALSMSVSLTDKVLSFTFMFHSGC